MAGNLTPRFASLPERCIFALLNILFPRVGILPTIIAFTVAHLCPYATTASLLEYYLLKYDLPEKKSLLNIQHYTFKGMYLSQNIGILLHIIMDRNR